MSEKPEVSRATRRGLLTGGAGVAAALALPQVASAAQKASPVNVTPYHSAKSQLNSSNTLELKDGTSIFYKDWGTGTPVVFSHGWPLTSDAWDAQMLHLGQNGFRVIAHDRRGHGRSSQGWNANNMDTYADDLAALMDHLNLKEATLVGHSTGGGEVARYVGRHGSKRVAKVVLVGAVPPWMAKSAGNPNGAPPEIFDGLRKGVREDRSQFYKDLSAPFFGANKPGAKPYEGLRESFWLQGMMGGIKAQYDCIKAFSETDFTADLKAIDVPALLVHGAEDQIVPIQISSELSVKLIKNASLKVYPGAPHGLPLTHQGQFNADLVDFIKS